MQSAFTFDLVPSNVDAPLTISVWLNSTRVFGPSKICKTVSVSVPIVDEPGSHLLHIDLDHKLSEHTVLDQTGIIVSDSMVTVQNPCLDATAIGNIFFKFSRYQHNTNGTTNPVDEQFFGTMGCNGRVSLPFETPAYLWLLDNM